MPLSRVSRLTHVALVDVLDRRVYHPSERKEETAPEAKQFTIGDRSERIRISHQ